MVSIYKLMEKDWKTYCLMCGITFIEEMSKPKGRIDKNGYLQYSSIRLKMKDEFTVNKICQITKEWENKKGVRLLGESFSLPKKESYDGQYSIIFSPRWLFEVLNTTKGLPSSYAFKIALERLKNWRRTRGKKILEKQEIDSLKNKEPLHNILFEDKSLAAGAFIVSLDLEFRSVESGRPNLTMSNTYKDFLKFMLKVANCYGWATRDHLLDNDVSYSRKLGINATDQSKFAIKSSSLKEIYELAGPLLDKKKDKVIKHNILRSSRYVNLGGKFRKRKTRLKILRLVRKLKNTTSTELQFYVNIGVDVVLDHLRRLERDGFVKRKRNGKRYVWSPKKCQ